MKLLELFSNRELAIFTWILIFVFIALVWRKLRPGVLQLVKAFFHKKIIGLQILTWSYISIIVWLFYQLGLWNMSMLKDTIIWTLLTSFLLIMKMMLSKNESSLKSIFIDAFKIIIVFEFVVNMYTFNYFAELVIIFLLAVLVAMITMAERTPEHHIVAKFLNWILAIWGFYVLYYSIKEVWAHYDVIEWSQTFLDFILPIWLTVLFIPFMYGVKLYSVWENRRIRNKSLRL